LLISQGCNLLLNGPINHLEIPLRSRFEQTLTRYQGTALAVVHDRYFYEQFASEIWRVEKGQVKNGDRGMPEAEILNLTITRRAI
jgi:ATP-binding cassette subfamily F protein 3